MISYLNIFCYHTYDIKALLKSYRHYQDIFLLYNSEYAIRTK